MFLAQDITSNTKILCVILIYYLHMKLITSNIFESQKFILDLVMERGSRSEIDRVEKLDIVLVLD